MRTTIDIPDPLMKRVKRAAAGRKTTVRMLVLDALERSLADKPQSFTLRDASEGNPSRKLDAATINRAIDEQREGPFNP